MCVFYLCYSYFFVERVFAFLYLLETAIEKNIFTAQRVAWQGSTRLASRARFRRQMFLCGFCRVPDIVQFKKQLLGGSGQAPI